MFWKESTRDKTKGRRSKLKVLPRFLIKILAPRKLDGFDSIR